MGGGGGGEGEEGGDWIAAHADNIISLRFYTVQVFSENLNLTSSLLLKVFFFFQLKNEKKNSERKGMQII